MKPVKNERKKIVRVGGYHTEEDTQKYIEAFRSAGLSDEQIKLIILYCGGYPFEDKDYGDEVIQ